MSDHEKSHDATERETTSEGEYTDVETASGRDTHKDDVRPGKYPDADHGDDES